MKEYYLVVEEFIPEKSDQIRKLIKQIAERKIESLHVIWKYYHTPLKKEMLDAIADLFAEAGRDAEFFVFHQVETDQITALFKLRRCFNRYGMYIRLGITPQLSVRTVQKLKQRFLLQGLVLPKGDYGEYRKYYERFRSCNVELCLDENALSADEFQGWFEDWLLDKEACWISCFRDLCYRILIGIHISDCRHNSCMGSHLCVDGNGMVYFCSQKRNGSAMYQLGETQQLYNEVYYDTLKRANTHRNFCKTDCTDFSFCQGGCILEMDAECNDTEYMDKVQVVRAYMMEHRRDLFTGMDNPLLRQLLIELVAYGIDVEQVQHG